MPLVVYLHLSAPDQTSDVSDSRARLFAGPLTLSCGALSYCMGQQSNVLTLQFRCLCHLATCFAFAAIALS
jgi:hypothetical protein